MKDETITVEMYLESISEDRRASIERLREVIQSNLPEGFEETVLYGMITYVVPLSIYPKGYHAKKNTPLPFLSVASQKHTINLYHMGMYAKPELLQWFQAEYKKRVNQRLDMGKSCIRFKTITDEVLGLIGDLCQRMTVEDMIALQEDRVG